MAQLLARHTLPETKACWAASTRPAVATINEVTPRWTMPRPVVVYVYASTSVDVQALLSELGLQLTEGGANIWFMIPGI